MTNYRIFLLIFLTVAWVFLSGLNQAVDNDMSTEETQKTDSAGADANRPTKGDELEKPLDLSLPYMDSENAELKRGQKPAAQSGVSTIFPPETKKKVRSLELDGNFLMSPEPEAEKLKSVDGAGIVIKLKR
jgi:hypothetical protein